MTFKENSNRNYGPRPPWAGTACLCQPPPDLDNHPSWHTWGQAHCTRLSLPLVNILMVVTQKKIFCALLFLFLVFICELFVFVVFGGCYFFMCAHIVVSLLAFTGFDLLY